MRASLRSGSELNAHPRALNAHTTNILGFRERLLERVAERVAERVRVAVLLRERLLVGDLTVVETVARFEEDGVRDNGTTRELLGSCEWVGVELAATVRLNEAGREAEAEMGGVDVLLADGDSEDEDEEVSEFELLDVPVREEATVALGVESAVAESVRAAVPEGVKGEELERVNAAEDVTAAVPEKVDSAVAEGVAVALLESVEVSVTERVEEAVSERVDVAEADSVEAAEELVVADRVKAAVPECV